MTSEEVDEYLNYLPAIKELIEKKISPKQVYAIINAPHTVPIDFYKKAVSQKTIELLQRADWDKLLYRFSKAELDTILSLLSSNAFEGEIGASIPIIKSKRGRKWLQEAQKLARGEGEG